MKKITLFANRKIHVIPNSDASKIMAGRRHAGQIRLGIEEDDDDRFEDSNNLNFLIRITRLGTR